MDIIPQLRCSRCKQFKDPSAFDKNPTYTRGYDYFCKECVSETRKQKRIEKHLANEDNWIINSKGKICPECGIRKPLSEFHKNKARKHGVEPYCKVCASEQNKADYSAHPEKYHEKAKREYWNGGKERNKKYAQEHRDEYNARARKKHLQKKEQHSARMKKHYAENKDTYKVRRHKRRSIMVQADGKFSTADIARNYDGQNGYCAYCGINLHGEYHIDHVQPLSRQGTNWPDNVVLTCAECNLSKHDKTLDEWTKVRGW